MQSLHRTPGFPGIDTLGALTAFEIVVVYPVISCRILIADLLRRQEVITLCIQHTQTLAAFIGSAGCIYGSTYHELVLFEIPVELNGSTIRFLVDLRIGNHSSWRTLHYTGAA